MLYNFSFHRNQHSVFNNLTSYFPDFLSSIDLVRYPNLAKKPPYQTDSKTLSII